MKDNHEYETEAIERDIVEVLTAISVVSKRLANNIVTLSRQSKSEKGVKKDEQNSASCRCNRRCACGYR